jgi:hypothetical protein
MLPSGRTLAIVVSAAGTAAASAFAYRDLERLRRPLQGCHSCGTSATLSNLRTSGVGVVDGLVDQKLINEIKATAAYQSIPTEVPKPTRGRQQHGPRGQASEKQSEWRMSALGRFHKTDAFDENTLEVMERVDDVIWPLVAAFFQDGDEDGTKGIYRSEMQVIVAEEPICSSPKFNHTCLLVRLATGDECITRLRQPGMALG